MINMTRRTVGRTATMMVLMVAALTATTTVSAQTVHEGTVSFKTRCDGDATRTLEVVCEYIFDGLDEDLECTAEYCDHDNCEFSGDDSSDFDIEPELVHRVRRGSDKDFLATFEYEHEFDEDTFDGIEIEADFDLLVKEFEDENGDRFLVFEEDFDCDRADPAEESEEAGTRDVSLTGCANMVLGWVDSYGDNCGWYEENDFKGCPYHGNKWVPYVGPFKGISPNEACCWCQKDPGPV